MQHASNFAELDQYGKDAAPQHAFAAGLELIPDGDHDCVFEDAEIINRGGHTMVRCDVVFPSLNRTIEHCYWLNRQEAVNAFLAEMAALGHQSHTWGSAPGKTPLSVAIPACVASLAGTRFRATKTTRVVPPKPDAYGQAAEKEKTYRDLRIQSRVSGSAMPTSAIGMSYDGTSPGKTTNGIPF